MIKTFDYTQVVEDDAYANVDAYIYSTRTKYYPSFPEIVEEEPWWKTVTTKSLNKNSTRAVRGERSFTILNSTKDKIRHTNAFLHENKNKSQLIKLFFIWLTDNRTKILNTPRTTSLYLPQKDIANNCWISHVSSIDSLVSTHEEADFRLMVHPKCYQFQSSHHQVTFWRHRHPYHGIDVVLFCQGQP